MESPTSPCPGLDVVLMSRACEGYLRLSERLFIQDGLAGPLLSRAASGNCPTEGKRVKPPLTCEPAFGRRSS
ncbi:hypothetical protein VULLAG_LOCUS19640 [Vulpes lagopus]